MYLDLTQIINFDFVKQVCFQVSDRARQELLEIKEDRIIFIEIILSALISASGQEATRLSNFSFEYFITQTPDKNGLHEQCSKKTRHK
jgi:hypothetical protein